MPRQFLVSSIRVALAASLIACLLALTDRSLADEPAPAKQPAKQIVEVRLWVVEVSKSKLRKLGFDWGLTLAKSNGTDSRKLDDEQFLGYITALEQNKIAHTLATPMIATRSGQKASIEMAPRRKIEVTPTVAAEEHVDLAYHIDIANAHGPGGRFISAHATELKSGIPQLLSETTSQHRTAKGEPNNSTILVLAQATIVK